MGVLYIIIIPRKKNSAIFSGGPFAYGSGSGDSSGAGGSGDDLPPDFEIIPENDIRFSIEGSGGSVLIINLFAPELNGSVIYCRERLMGELIANFTLRSTRTYNNSIVLYIGIIIHW